MDQAHAPRRLAAQGRKTDIPLSVLGLAAAYATGFSSQCAALALNLAGVLYALLCYPRYFEDGCLAGKDPRIVSFSNTLLGGFFGLLWNRSLTRGQRGMSHVAYAILPIASYALAVATGAISLAP